MTVQASRSVTGDTTDVVSNPVVLDIQQSEFNVTAGFSATGTTNTFKLQGSVERPWNYADASDYNNNAVWSDIATFSGTNDTESVTTRFYALRLQVAGHVSGTDTATITVLQN